MNGTPRAVYVLGLASSGNRLMFWRQILWTFLAFFLEILSPNSSSSGRGGSNCGGSDVFLLAGALGLGCVFLPAFPFFFLGTGGGVGIISIVSLVLNFSCCSVALGGVGVVKFLLALLFFFEGAAGGVGIISMVSFVLNCICCRVIFGVVGVVKVAFFL